MQRAQPARGGRVELEPCVDIAEPDRLEIEQAGNRDPAAQRIRPQAVACRANPARAACPRAGRRPSGRRRTGAPGRRRARVPGRRRRRARGAPDGPWCRAKRRAPSCSPSPRHARRRRPGRARPGSGRICRGRARSRHGSRAAPGHPARPRTSPAHSRTAGSNTRSVALAAAARACGRKLDIAARLGLEVGDGRPSIVLAVQA